MALEPAVPTKSKKWQHLHVIGMDDGKAGPAGNAADIIVDLCNRYEVVPGECMIIASYKQMASTIVHFAVYTAEHIGAEVTLNIRSPR